LPPRLISIVGQTKVAKEMTTQSTFGWLVATVMSAGVYTGLFLYLLGFKALRHIADKRETKTWLVTEVILGTVTLILTLEAAVLIFFDRNLSGKFFFLTVIAGVCLMGWSTAGISVFRPIKAALGLGYYTWKGLMVGWVTLIVSNVLCFFFKVPSLL
jgi:hypothetical protein